MTIALIISAALNVLLIALLAAVLYLQRVRAALNASAMKEILDRVTKLEVAASQKQKVMVVERPATQAPTAAPRNPSPVGPPVGPSSTPPMPPTA